MGLYVGGGDTNLPEGTKVLAEYGLPPVALGLLESLGKLRGVAVENLANGLREISILME
jgi:hypothetical protein